MATPQKAKAGEPEAPAEGGFNPFQPLASFGVAALDGALDLVLGPATEEQLRGGNAVVGVAKLRKRRKAKKEDSLPVDLNIKIRLEAQQIVDRLNRQEAAEREQEAKKSDATKGNITQLLTMAAIQTAQLYATSQACLLAVFVPQKCPAINASDYTSPIFEYTEDQPDGHLCSLKENLDWPNCTFFNQSVLALNLATLFIVLSATGYYWTREVWLVGHLEEEESLPYNHLPTMYEAYPNVKANVMSLNLGAFLFASCVCFSVLANFVITSVFLFEGDELYNYNLGSRTVTALITNMMLITSKITGYLSYSRMSYRNEWGISMFNVIPLSFNMIDSNYR